MKLKVIERKADKKSEAKRLRRDGSIPAALYSKGKTADNIAVDRAEIEALIRSIPKGTLSTTIVTIVDEKGKERRAIVKDVQYHPTTYDILHMDFEELIDDVLVNINVPIVCTGIVDCVGIKLGGVLRQVIRTLKVRCLPKDIPRAFELNIASMGQLQSKRLADLDIPSTVRPLANLNEVAVAIVKR